MITTDSVFQRALSNMLTEAFDGPPGQLCVIGLREAAVDVRKRIVQKFRETMVRLRAAAEAGIQGAHGSRTRPSDPLTELQTSIFCNVDAVDKNDRRCVFVR